MRISKAVVVPEAFVGQPGYDFDPQHVVLAAESGLEAVVEVVTVHHHVAAFQLLQALAGGLAIRRAAQRLLHRFDLTAAGEVALR